MKAAHRSSCVAGQSPRSLPGRTMNPGAVCAKELKQGVTTAAPETVCVPLVTSYHDT